MTTARTRARSTWPIDAMCPGTSSACCPAMSSLVDGEVVAGRSAFRVRPAQPANRSRIDVAPGARAPLRHPPLAGPDRGPRHNRGPRGDRVGKLVASIERLCLQGADRRFVDRVAGRFVAVVSAARVLTRIALSTRSFALRCRALDVPA